MRYEVLLARGKTIKDFERAINDIADIRQGEINHALDQGLDVLDHEAYWFQPKSPVNFVNGEYTQVWMRQKP